MDPENKNKLEFLNHLLSEGDAMVCLDARLPDVDVPKMHKHNGMLNLVFNLSFRRPFEVNDSGIFATLSFGGRPHKCVIPFEAVWAIYEPNTQKGQVWETSIPEDLDLADKMTTAETVETEPPKTPASPPKSKTTGKPGTGAKSGRDRSHLRVIK